MQLTNIVFRHPVSRSVTSFTAISACLVAMLFSSVPASIGKAGITEGPAHVKLGEMLADIDLPAKYEFVDKETTEKFLKQQGGTPDGVLGMIVPTDEKDGNFFVVCRFEDVGYVNDDDANKINAQDILNTYKDGAREQNDERKELDLPPIYVGGWAEEPHYKKDSHQVIWAIQIKDDDAETAPVTDINYNTRILGRRGVLSLNLVTAPEDLATNKTKVATLLDATHFVKTQTYADYNPKTDKKAEFGLAGLILGGGAMAAAAKMGVFGAISKWFLAILLVFKKFAIVGIAAVGAIIAKLFGKKQPQPEQMAQEPQKTDDGQV
jgi:uncharacterized membrane-anchored protein